jgi:DnaJ-domain-containing protein 1
MGIPLWIWLIIGLSLLSWIIPDGIPGEEFLLPAVAVISLLLRRRFMKNFYQKQYQQYQKQGQAGAGFGGSGPGSTRSGTGGAGQSSSSFYNRFKNWGAGFQQPPGTQPLKDPYDILGIKRGAPMVQIKKAYRDQLKKFHPDKVESLKLGPEYREMFEEKTREIQKAYEALGGK